MVAERTHYLVDGLCTAHKVSLESECIPKDFLLKHWIELRRPLERAESGEVAVEGHVAPELGDLVEDDVEWPAGAALNFEAQVEAGDQVVDQDFVLAVVVEA